VNDLWARVFRELDRWADAVARSSTDEGLAQPQQHLEEADTGE